MKPEDVSDELVDIFARKFWAFPLSQLERGPQDAARQALAPVLTEHERQLRHEANGLRRENNRLREENVRHSLNAESEVCTGCMQREQQRDAAWATARDNGVKYEQTKQARHREQDRARQAEAERDALKDVIARAERLRDKWLSYPVDDMHYAAGLMLASHLSGEAFTAEETNDEA